MKQFRHHTFPPILLAGTATLLTSVGLVSLTLLAGCGASGGVTTAASSSAPTARAAQATGKAVFAVQWPAKTVNGRLIPFAANSIVLRLTSTDGTKLFGSTVLMRPSGGGAASATFDRVPVGQATLTATAYPNTDGTGTAQASAQTPVTVVQDQTASVTLTMATTIAKVTVTPATDALTIGNTAPLVATATDAAGNVVLVSSSTLAWTSSAATIASVDATGTVTAVKAGTATITVKETESGMSGTAAITVSAAATPTPSPTPVVSPAATISFAAPVTYDAPAASDMLAADLDGDGNADIAVESNGNLVVFWGHGDGTFDPAQIVYNGIGTGVNPRPRAAVDMDNDGKLDLVCSADTSTAYVFYNTGNRTFSKVVVVPVPGGTKSGDVAVADFDGDGLIDLAVMLERSSGGGSGSIRIVKNNGSGNFTLGASYTVGTYAEGVTAGDINGDGKPDMIGTYINSGGGSTVYLGKGDGTFTTGSSYNTASQNIPIPILADFNKDGKIDLGVDDYFDNNMGILFGNGDGTFQTVAKYSAAPYPLVWQAVDLDGDGYPDIVAPNAGTGNFTVLRNQGNGLFGAAVQFSSGGSNTRCSATADFNKDGRPDLAFGCESSNSIEILLNTSK